MKALKSAIGSGSIHYPPARPGGLCAVIKQKHENSIIYLDDYHHAYYIPSILIPNHCGHAFFCGAMPVLQAQNQ
jgi:hypothetical protein